MKWIKKPIRENFNTKKDVYIKNIDKCVSRIIEHINKKSIIAIFTDFDLDGLGCSYIWDWFFEKINYEYILKIPHRNEGYGLNFKWIDLYKHVDLIITCDNGVTKNEEVEHAKFYGIETIVTDHHNPKDELPNCIVVNPKCGSSEFTKDLCGTGVSWYIVRELIDKLNIDADPMEIIDMVCISTIADLVELDGANRAIVKYGLKMINENRFSSEGLRKLFKNYNQEIHSDTIAFGVAPILNAISRLDDMNIAFQYLRRGKLEIYDNLIENNNKRKDIQFGFSEKAIKEVDDSKKILIYKNDEIPKGIIGLVAGDLTNKFYKPVIVLANNHGSGRSVDDINLYDLVFKSNNNHIDSGGGHASALGIGISDFNKFKTELEEYCIKNIKNSQIEPRKYYWKDILIEDIEEIYNYINNLRPFGMGNEAPSVVVRNQVVSEYSLIGKNKNVLSIRLKSGIKCIKFKYDNEYDIKIGDCISLLGKINKNEWNNITTYQILIEDIKGE